MANSCTAKRYAPTLLKCMVAALRFIVGGVFIFSGFVKAIDPWGTVYKFSEYFSVFGLSEYMILVAFLTFAVAIGEFCLGVMMFCGIYRRATPVLLTLIMCVMLPLTLYIAVTDSVADCGCFGDLVHLSNWSTFIKNIFLISGVLLLLFFNKKLVNYYGAAVQWLIVVSSMIYITVIAVIGYYQQPLLDFRPFKVGTPIIEHGLVDVREATSLRMVYTNGTETRAFSVDSLPEDDEWDFVERIEGRKSAEFEKNHALVINDNQSDITAQLLGLKSGCLMLLFPNLEDIEISYTFAINELYDFARKHDVQFFALASGSNESVMHWRDISMATYDIYTIDDSVLKQIARGNPAIVYIEDGIIRWKSSLQAIPLERFEHAMDSLADINVHSYDYRDLVKYTLIYVGFLILLLIINRTHRLPAINRFLKSYYANLLKKHDV